MRFSCELCYRKFKRKANVASHQLAVHKEDLHFLEGEFPKDFSCTECDKWFVSLNTLEYHQRIGHNKQKTKKSAYCKLCYLSFKYKGSFTAHIKKWHKARKEKNALDGKVDPDQLTQNCLSCDLKFLTKNILSRHTKYGHAGSFKISCKLCYVTYRNQNDFDKHIESLHNSEQEKYALGEDIDQDMLSYNCDHCEKKFLTENILSYHTRYYHQKRKRQTVIFNSKKKEEDVNDSDCRLCYVDFKYPSQLERHKKVVHKGELDAFEKNVSELEMIFSCKKCEKQFCSVKSLNYHTVVLHPRFRSAKRKIQKRTNPVLSKSAIMPRRENFQYNYMFDFVNNR